MAEELKTIKFQLMLSEAEAKEIDDWGFENRIRTRAETIRRLCKISIDQKEELRILNTLLGGAYDWGLETLDITRELVDPKTNEESVASRTALFTLMSILAAKIAAGDLQEKEKRLRTIEDFEHAVNQAAERTIDSLESEKILEKFWSTFKEKLPGKAFRPERKGKPSSP